MEKAFTDYTDSSMQAFDASRFSPCFLEILEGFDMTEPRPPELSSYDVDDKPSGK